MITGKLNLHCLLKKGWIVAKKVGLSKKKAWNV
jgi:hypothetical protein